MVHEVLLLVRVDGVRSGACALLTLLFMLFLRAPRVPLQPQRLAHQQRLEGLRRGVRFHLALADVCICGVPYT